nr:phosphatase PAP2 family protein [Paraburkholderia phosphatilytica]
MWSAISNVGDPALTLPVAAACATWLALSDTRLACRWIVLFCTAMAMIGATKLLYLGYGWELQSLDFRVISGHTALATSVWTITLALLSHNFTERAVPGAAAGLLLGLLTAAARVFDHTHSLPEVIAGWSLGAAIAVAFVHTLRRANVRLAMPYTAPFVILSIAYLAYGWHFPLEEMMECRLRGVCKAVSAHSIAIPRAAVQAHASIARKGKAA